MEEKKCKVHGKPLKLIKVGVDEGLPHFDKILIEARSKLFPNAKRNILGGCTIGESGDWAKLLVCDECTKAEIRWRKENNYPAIQNIRNIKI